MARNRKVPEKVDIDVVPYLSIMVIVLKLISLILVIIVIRIAVNPKSLKAVSLNLFTSRSNVQTPKIPVYIDCWHDHLILYPGEKKIPLDEFQRSDKQETTLEKFLNSVTEKRDKQYVVLMVRPNAVKTFRKVRGMLDQRKIDVGTDAVTEKFKINWDEAVKAMAISEEPEPSPMEKKE